MACDSALSRDRARLARVRAPQIDLLQGRYALSKRGARFQVRVKQLAETTFLAFEVSPLNVGWDRVVVYRERGRTVAKVYYIDNEEEVRPYLRKCPRLEVTWSFATDTVSADIPMSCLQASQSASPGEHGFRTFSRVGGMKNPPRDSIRTVDLYL